MDKILTQKRIKRLEKRALNKKDKEWREQIKKEFNSSCIICGRTDIIHCHHLIEREIKILRHEVLNGICLCPNHHKFNLQISAHRNPLIFSIWYSNNHKERYEKLLEICKNLNLLK